MKNLFRLFLLALALQAASVSGQITVPLPSRSIVKLLPDYAQPKVYALNRGNGATPGTLLAHNSSNGAVLAEISLGLNPTDMAMSPAGDALYVINTGARTLMKVDLATFAVTATRSFTTPTTYDVNNPLHIAAGPSGRLFFTDGAWGPQIYFFNFDAGSQQLVLNTGGNGSHGAGGIVLNRNGNQLYTWAQYGWGAGSVNSWVTRFDAATNGNLASLETSFTSWRRDPFDTPLLLNGAETLVFNKQQMFAATDVGVLLQSFSENIYAVSLDGAVAFGDTKLFNTQNGTALTNFSFATAVQSLSGDQRRLFRYRADVSDLYVYDMSQLASVSGPSPVPTPADGSVVGITPTNLSWTASPVGLSYRVFFGTNQAQVAAANTNSAQYLGAVASTSIPLNRPMQPGSTYFWRLDTVGFSAISTGLVWSFTIAPIAVIPQRLDIGAITAYNPAPSALALTSAVPRSWTAAVRGANWASLGSTNGNTPANITISFTTTNLAVGLYSNIVDITSGGITVSVPITLDVRPLNITKMVTDYQRPYIYALQPPPFAGQSGQLLVINTATENIEKALPIGDNPTDFTIHYAENRLYVANWGRDETYVVNLSTHTMMPSLHLGTDVYKINAGRAGRLYIEGLDQWITVSIIDTATGASVGTLPWPQRQGDGEVSPTGDAYYHNDDNISNAHLHKYRLTGDVATEVGSSLEHPYGSRNLVLSPDGTRIFWRGYVYDTALSGPSTNNLAELAYLGAEVYATTIHGELAFTETSVLNTRNGQSLYTLPVSSTVLAVSGDQQKVFLYDSGPRRLRVIPMAQIAPVPGPGLVPTPADNSVIGLPLPQLSWTVNPFAIEYRVFFGTNQAAVAAATTNSLLFVGATTVTSFPVPAPLQYNTTYFWRVDSIGFNSSVTGAVWRFTAAPIAVAPQSISLKGVVGLPILPETISVSAPSPTAWTVTADQPWLSVNTNSGSTPATVSLSFNTVAFTNGVYTNTLNFVAGGLTLRLPVSLELFNLEATQMLTDRDRPYVYVLHRGSGNYEDAFLLFLNTDTGIVEKVLPIGRNPTDMSINRAENRLYVLNFGTGFLREVDLNTKSSLPSLPVSASADRVNAGRAGRAVLEEWNQWIYAYLIDTTNNGATLATAFFREGDGEFDPTGRYYYHSDNNSSGAVITKYDLNNSTFVSLGSAGPHYYYGSRHIVMSLDGSRLFWTGAVYDANVVDLGNIGAEIYASSTNGTLAFSSTQAYDTATRLPIFTLPVATGIMAVDRLDQRLWYFNPSTKQIQSLAMSIIRSPTITQQPAGASVAAGSPVYLSVTASGYGPLSYQWRFNGTNLSGQTDFFLSFANAQPDQSGSYQVVVSNPYGSVTSTIAQVTVFVSPTITQQPQNTTALAGSTASFSVQATGTAPLRYQWTFEGANLSGATNATLTLSNVQPMNAGAYRVLVSNAAGSVNSASAILRVTPVAPMIVSHPTNLTVTAGNAASFAVTVSGSAPFTYQWWLNGSAIPAFSPVLTLSNAQSIHAGNYFVIVANSLGKATSAIATLTVTPIAPQFVLQPQSRTLMAGTNNVLLTSLAIGTEPISYRWRFNGANLSNATAPTLLLSNASVAQSGNYSVVASNTVGWVTSLVATVTITAAPPVFVQHPLPTTIPAGANLTLNSLALGSEPLTYQWTFQGTNLPGRTSRSLVITNITPANGGAYAVIASNVFAAVTSSVATVTVAVSPTIAALANHAVDAGSNLTLAASARGSAPFTYTWQFNGTNLPNASSSNLFLGNVQPWQAGSYRVIVANQYGTASSSMGLTVFPRPGSVVAWGDDTGGQSSVPTNLNAAVSVAGGDYHSVALLRGGTVRGWGYDGDGQATPPTPLSNVVAVAAGAAHNLAIGLDGRVTAWGRNDYGQSSVPNSLTSVVAVAAGEAHSVAVRQDGGVVLWGDNSLGQRPPPQGLGFVTAVAAGRNHTIALRNNGTVAAWGLNSHGQCNVPIGLSGVISVAAGYLHNVALRANGTLVAWGDNTHGQTALPGLSNVIAIAAGELHSLALLADGRVVAWGNNSFGQLDLPASLSGVSAASSGYYHGLAIVPPMLNFGMTDGGMRLWWSGDYLLQKSASPAGPFEDMNATSPCTNSCSPGTAAQFFRLRALP
jgi:hypothetical protein